MMRLVTLILALAPMSPLCANDPSTEAKLPRHLGPFELGATVGSLRHLGLSIDRDYSIGCLDLQVSFDQFTGSPVDFVPEYGITLTVDGESDNSKILSIEAYVSNSDTRRIFDKFKRTHGRPYRIDELTFAGEWPSTGYADEYTVIQIPTRPLSGDSLTISDRSRRSVCDNGREFEGDPLPVDEPE
jgi:hypothetical protein